MAKVTGPLMSMDASGAFGGALVFGKWKGRPTVRQLVTPANPNSLAQENARNRVRVGGAVQHQINLSVQKASGETLTDKQLLQAAAPAGFAWNGNLVDQLIGTGGLTYTAMEAAWAALTAPQKSAWDSAAAGLVPAYGAVYQTGAGGVATTAKTAGFAFFAHRYAMYSCGVATIPTATPPTYA